MDVLEAIRTRRSVRHFLPQPVPRDVLEQIVAAGIEAPSGCNMQLRQYVIVDDPKVMDQVRTCSKSIADAPCAIVMLLETKASPYGEFWVQDASAAMQNMLLAAVGLGYGACWIEGAVRRVEEDLRKLLAAPAHLRVWSLLPVGKPAAQPARPPKSEPQQVTFFNRYAQGK